MSEDNSGGKKRRDVLKALPVATVGVSMASGVGAAMPDTSETSDERMTREEKAREAGYDWDEDWIDEDMIGKNGVMRTETETFSKNGHTNCVGLNRTLAGIKWAVEFCFKPGEVVMTFAALDQEVSRTLDFESGEVCETYDLNAGAAHIDIQICVDTDKCVDIKGEGCVWEVYEWNCGTTDTTRCL